MVFTFFPLRKRYGLEWGGKRLSTNYFKYLLLTVGANLLVVLLIEIEPEKQERM